MQKANGKIFSALKMIEALYLDNKISCGKRWCMRRTNGVCAM